MADDIRIQQFKDADFDVSVWQIRSNLLHCIKIVNSWIVYIQQTESGWAIVASHGRAQSTPVVHGTLTDCWSAYIGWLLSGQLDEVP